MDALSKGWFSELNGLWPGQTMSLEVEKVLHSEKSQYQDILIFQRSPMNLSLASFPGLLLKELEPWKGA